MVNHELHVFSFTHSLLPRSSLDVFILRPIVNGLTLDISPGGIGQLMLHCKDSVFSSSQMTQLSSLTFAESFALCDPCRFDLGVTLTLAPTVSDLAASQMTQLSSLTFAESLALSGLTDRLMLNSCCLFRLSSFLIHRVSSSLVGLRQEVTLLRPRRPLCFSDRRSLFWSYSFT